MRGVRRFNGAPYAIGTTVFEERALFVQFDKLSVDIDDFIRVHDTAAFARHSMLRAEHSRTRS